MLSKAIVFVFSFLGIFTLLLGTFNTVPFPINEGSGGTPTEIRKNFDVANMTVYGTGGTDDMAYQYSSYYNGPTPPNWETKSSGKYLEVWWSLGGGAFYGTQKYINLRDVQEEWWGLDHHRMRIYKRNGQAITTSTDITKAILVDNYESTYNATYFSAKCDHLAASILFQYNYTLYSSIGTAWDAGHLGYQITYGLDYNGTGLSAWSIVGSLLAFQAPEIGITGIGGTILSGIIAAPLIACVMYLAYKIITGIIPWVSGGSGD